MKVLDDYRQAGSGPRRGRGVTIGNYDGVHLGHQAVLAHARREAASRGLELAVLTFEPHPAELLRPDLPPRRLVEPQRKAELLGECGADLVLAQRFDTAFSALDAGEFVEQVLVSGLGARLVIVGDNFRFGAGRAGDIDLLRKAGARLGFEVSGEPLTSDGARAISSSRIRDLLAVGDVAGARRLLGREHEVSGTVVRGEGSGRQLGFPTANLGELNVVHPGPGIYAARALVDGAIHPAAAYVGDRPTLGHGRSVEAHLIDFEGDIYGKRITVYFTERVRGDRRFDGPAELVAQISRDVARAREILEEHGG